MAVIISDNNRGLIVNISAWFGTTVMILAVFTRIVRKYSEVQKWLRDDTLIVLQWQVYFLKFGVLRGLLLTL